MSAQQPDDGLCLLGCGLDAIIAHTRQPRAGLLSRLFPAAHDPGLPHTPTEDQRRKRYYDAAVLTCDRMYYLRAEIGERFQAAWKRGQRPDLRAIAQRMPRTTQAEVLQLRRYAETVQ